MEEQNHNGLKLGLLLTILLVAVLAVWFYFGNMVMKEGDKNPNTSVVKEETLEVKPYVPSDGEMEITLYFGNSIKNPNLNDCTLVYPVKRNIGRALPWLSTMQELIKGPTEKEKTEGYVALFPINTSINSINLDTGTLSIDFSKAIEENFTSCSGSLRLTSIEKTFLEFPNIKKIKLGVDGNWNRDEILQP